MKSNKINYLLILIGGLVAIYAQAGNTQNIYILILGIVILMFGIYRISKYIPSKLDSKENTNTNPNEDV